MRALLVVAGLSLPLLSSLAAGCDGCDPGPPDGGASIADAGGRPLADAGGGSDAGETFDSGVDDDAGASPDGGSSLDAGVLLDAGGLVDSGAADDAGTPVDGGALVDGGVLPGDAGAGTEADAGDDVVEAPCTNAGVALRLTWSTVGDLDLHLSLAGADWCSDEDCFWANCRPDADPPREWDNVVGASAGDPVLVTDTAAGLGPEVLCIDAPFIADYVVGVRYQPFSGWPATDARLEVFSDGVLVEDVGLSGFSPGEYWQPGIVAVSAGDVAFVGAPRRCEVSDGWICQDAPGDCPALP